MREASDELAPPEPPGRTAEPLPAERPAPRATRCANHPGVPSAGACRLCGRPLCVGCAVPVRGELVGPECLARVLADVPVPTRLPPPFRPHGDRLAVAGFGAIIALSVLPWSRFSGSGLFSAWKVHWSLLSIGAAVAGLLVTLLAWRRPYHPRLEGALIGGLAVASAGAALLHFTHPPPLTNPTIVPILALPGACLALLGGAIKVGAGLRVTAYRP